MTCRRASFGVHHAFSRIQIRGGHHFNLSMWASDGTEMGVRKVREERGRARTIFYTYSHHDRWRMGDRRTWLAIDRLRYGCSGLMGCCDNLILDVIRGKGEERSGRRLTMILKRWKGDDKGQKKVKTVNKRASLTREKIKSD